MHATAEMTRPERVTEDITIRVLRSISEIEQVRDVWTSWQIHPNVDLDFYLMIQNTRSEVVRPHVLILYRDGRPDAMLVGRLEYQRLDVKLGYAKFLQPTVRVLNVVYGGCLGNISSENGQLLIRELLKGLRNNEADLAILRFVTSTSPLYILSRTLPGILTRDYCPTLQPHWGMHLPANVDEVYRALSAEHRNEVRRKAKKLLADFSGKVSVRCVREALQVPGAMEEVEHIAKKTYQRGLGAGFADNEETRRRLLLDAERGRLRIYILTAGDNACAFWIGSVCQGTFYSSFLGYDPSYGKYSPGTFLLVRMIEDFCDSGVQVIDFGFGDARYKERFGNFSWEEGSIHVFAPTVKGLWLNALRTPMMLADAWGKKLLGETQLLPRVKRFWRRHVTARA
jgi:hypothetical protein